LIRPLSVIRSRPDQQELVNGVPHGPCLRDQEDAGALIAREELAKMPRHRSHVMRNEDATLTCRMGQDVGVWHPIQRQGLLRALKVDSWLATLETTHDGVVEIRIREEPRLHD
jgi:hypothetical protein